MQNGLLSIEDLLKKSAPLADDSDDAKKSVANEHESESATAVTQNIEPAAKAKTEAKMSPEELLGEKMGKIELQSKEAQAQQEAANAGVSYVDLKGFAISTDALTIISEEQARALNVICFLYTGPELRVGAVNPADQKIKDLVFQLGERYKSHAQLYKISQQSFDLTIEYYARLPKARKIVKGVQIKQEELEKYQKQMNNFADIQGVLQSANVTDIIGILVAAALKMRSSDIHIEAEENGIAARLRVDGILQNVAMIDHDQWKKIINRIKLIAGLKLNVNDRPQDGRFTIFQKDKKIDVRTSTLPTAWGESVVMRILNPESIQLEFEQLGFRPAALKRLEAEIHKPHGMIVTTGPTGSGKTTTLYAILQKLNQPGVKIITLEDPVEYKLEGINQSQIDHSKDYTFAKGLRSILRQDPDIVLVGEIRDLETGETAIQAALTGHLLLSTIHTNDAAGAIPRFISMGVKPFLLAPAINAIMGQRLLRRLCEKCKKPVELDADTKAQVKASLEAIPESSGEPKPDTTNMKFMGPIGCAECNNSGYKGRVGVYEILTKNAEIEQVILSGQISEYKMREVAQKQGMVTMGQDGLLKALEGDTSVEEVMRVTGIDPATTAQTTTLPSQSINPPELPPTD
ncbi:hypothetical protein CO057_00490 [Candidatus Uhrbacteria bacterium CG_4_9_14_0_2_um_filter_41_50]|uniref:Bacterial type II secretion system protein E domain-containing protein n=1 Tax=Candidatus Uhrbacteria bacterium CG_4_9_14_0_2_um_filter_41_50 TaxID=1975031 RepID=A0A2M8EQ73_9BACT|nr:MAG: hypothetical protein COZ45_02265 [Candidatus Uhrbacteria bacterium CG_4_10_14_3_um_filter_41_21]PIZ54491.1 MAG: hypothetical protein COY24_03625 [Candidatus Uhrbacteria bacterium CG_4_10_14_0_2_um_filter_41_21]PJB84841.1 MAG: hypothetical protein CO086_01470 [Candidatus Uhrbacteria bacterium CG_4_9_14_0_8_um_filter_41_16]PJC24886.1 MAG: hypothetical protein CO057_00490 [Candidatus Uhrbacteria bacterium CG_4_9_14_0_2_um_filter_41_50]PJE75226.1 MAG: hypothetical protein COV03_01130 [Candi